MNQELADTIKAAMGNYPTTRRVYYEAVFVSVYDYLDGSEAITKYKNAFRLATTNAFLSAAEIGWEDGGGKLPLDPMVIEWLSGMQAAEYANIDVLFVSLRALRTSGDEVEKVNIATKRAEGYSETLDLIYNYAKVAAAKNKMLTFVGEDGKESCSDCRKYKNKRHRAKWWIDHDAVPPNRGFECKGYNCQHVLVDDNGMVWTL